MTAPHQSHANHPVRQGFAIGTTAACLLFVAGIVAVKAGHRGSRRQRPADRRSQLHLRIRCHDMGLIHIVLGIIGIAVSLDCSSA